MNLEIDVREIENSFDRIANEILNNMVLQVNNVNLDITEIEFYYFYDKKHEDNYTHEHKRDTGEWRFHNQGLDITLPRNEFSDGGILIRGLKHEKKYVNGPRKIITRMFEIFGKVDSNNSLQLLKSENKNLEIIKTFRHLPNKQIYPKFHLKHYRYLVSLDKLDMPNRIKELIKLNNSKI